MTRHHTSQHPYHIVDPSPWPLMTALGALVTAVGAVLAIHQHGVITFFIGALLLVGTLIFWLKDVVTESSLHHNKVVQRGLKYGFLLFIATEIMFFVGFFWAFFDARLNPTEAIGHAWPPQGVHPVDAFHLPLLNTLILLLSATSLTWAHDAIQRKGDLFQKEVLQGLLITIFLGLAFTSIQILEYSHASFVMKDSIYGSNFYMLTGFHGVHVLIGIIFLSVCLVRSLKHHFTTSHHVGFETAVWYWHFVDVVWLFLFVFVYWWGS